MNEKYLAPCGAFCGTCKFLNRTETPNCLGCGSQEGQPFWGTCKIYTCAAEQTVNHCGDCNEFPCDLFVSHYDPSQGPKSAFTRAGLLAYRKRAGDKKYIEIATKLTRARMKDPAEEAIVSFRRWSAGFNSRDTEVQLAEMHFPHLRLVQNRFQWWATSDDFRVVQEENTRRLKQEGWHHTTTVSIQPIQVGVDKVHLAIRQSRQHSDGTEYNGFDTLWIFTRRNGRWGVQFRSSFLTNTRASGLGSSEPP